jgi:hypothetical protein
MKRNSWMYAQVLLVLWSFHLLTTYLSAKDHLFADILFFAFVFWIGFYVGRFFNIQRSKRLLYITTAYVGIFIGYILFQQL